MTADALSVDLADRIHEVKRWAYSRITHCREEERKFGHGLGTTKGPPQALVESWTERRTLQAVLEMLDPGCVERIDAFTASLRVGTEETP